MVGRAVLVWAMLAAPAVASAGSLLPDDDGHLAFGLTAGISGPDEAKTVVTSGGLVFEVQLPYGELGVIYTASDASGENPYWSSMEMSLHAGARLFEWPRVVDWTAPGSSFVNVSAGLEAILSRACLSMTASRDGCARVDEDDGTGLAFYVANTVIAFHHAGVRVRYRYPLVEAHRGLSSEQIFIELLAVFDM